MIFSYGFLEQGRSDAKQMFLELDIPGDDPLKMAKKRFCNETPGVRLLSTPSSEGYNTTSDSSFAWWACVNEEDGLDFNVLQMTDGSKQLKATWKGEDMEDSSHLKNILRADPLWDIFQLRVVVIILERLTAQLSAHYEMERILSEIRIDEPTLHAIFRPDVLETVCRLRKLESVFLESCIDDLTMKVGDIMTF